jgi:ribosomal protein L24E
MKPNCQCEFCGKLIYKKSSSIKKYSKHYCDRTCQIADYKKNSSIEEVECKECGVKVLKTRNQRRSSTGLFFCSRKCGNRYKAKNLRHKNSFPKSHRHVKDNVYYDFDKNNSK